MRSHTFLRPHRRGGGFTFMEILFAVMILGIGFIMVAAMFPAALRQTQANVEENEFNTTSHIAARDLENLALNSDPRYPAYAKAHPGQTAVRPARWLDELTAWVANVAGWPVEYDPTTANQYDAQTGRPIPFSFHDRRLTGYSGTIAVVPNIDPSNPGPDTSVDVVDSLWDLVRGNMINLEKPSNAWVALWARPTRRASPGNTKLIAAPSLQLFIFPVRSRAKPAYDPSATVYGSNPLANNAACDLTYAPANLDPMLLAFQYYPPVKGSAVATNTTAGVFQVMKNQPNNSSGVATIMVDISQNPALNPVTEGAYVVVSDSAYQINCPYYPKKYNGMIFKIGPEVANQNGDPGTSGGLYWSVSDVINLPSESPFGISSPGSIESTAFTSSMQGVYGLVIGRQPDPADPVQQKDAQRTSASQQGALFNRTGTAQELGFYPWSVIVQQ